MVHFRFVSRPRDTESKTEGNIIAARFDETITVMTCGQLRQRSNIYSDGIRCTSGAGHGKEFTFYATSGNCDGSCPTVDVPIRNSNRQNDIKGGTGGCRCLELVSSNLLQ